MFNIYEKKKPEKKVVRAFFFVPVAQTYLR